MKKKSIIVALTLAATATGFTLTACSNKGGAAGDVDLEALVKSVILNNNGDKVNSDFNVPSYVSTETGKKYKLTWTSTNTDLLTFTYVEDDPDTPEDESLEDATAVINQGDKLTEVTFYATISEGDKQAKSEEFSVRIEKKLSAEDQFKAFYDGAADKVKGTVTGYVLAKAGKSVYNEKGQCCLYIASDTYGPGAYYAYNCYMDEADYDALQVGDFVTVKNAQFQSYNGIIEACYGDVVRDASKKISAEEVTKKTQDITADVEAASDLERALFYKQGNRVQLKGAKIKAITEAAYVNTKGKYSSTTQDVLTLEVNGNTMKLVLEEGITGFADAGTKTLFDGLVALEVGSYVDVEGLLVGTGAIAVESADSCKAAASVPTWALLETTAAETTFEPFTEDAEVVLPTAGTAYDNVAITWALKDTYQSATITDGKLVVTPKTTEETVVLVGTFTANGTTKTVEYTFTTQALTTEEKLAKEAELFSLDEAYFTNAEPVALITAGKKFPTIAITYAVKEGGNAIQLTTDNKIKFKAVDADTNVIITVTFTLDDKTVTKDVEFTVKNPEVTVSEAQTPVAGTGYDAYTYSAQLGKTIYYTGVMSGYYLATADAPASAKKVYVEAVTGGYNVYTLGENNAKVYIVAYVSGTYYNVSLQSTTDVETLKTTLKTEKVNAVWTFDEANNIIMSLDGKTFFLGTRNKYNTLGIYETSNLTSATYFATHLGQTTVKAYTRAEKVAFEAAKLTNNIDAKSTVEYDLNTTPMVFDDVEISYAVKAGDTTGTVVEDGKVTFGTVGSATNVTIVATLTCNGETTTKEFTFEVAPLEFKDVTEAVDGKTTGDSIMVTGVVTSKTSSYCWISDGTTDFQVYGLDASSKYKFADINVGDVIYVMGTYKLYNTTHETDSNTGKIIDKGVATAEQKLAITASELALADIDEDVVDQQLATAGTTFTDATISWAPKATYAGVTVTDNKLTATQQADDVAVTLVATITAGTKTTTKEVSFTLKKVSATKVVKTSYSGTGIAYNTDPVLVYDTEDYAEALGLNTTIFNVICTKGDGNGVAIYSSDVRLYWKSAADKTNGGSITYSVGTGYVIDSVKITYTSDDYGANAKVYAGSVELTATDGVFTVNGSSFTIKNEATANKQVRIKEVEITYTKTA